MGGPKKPLPRDSPPGGYGWSKSGFPNTTYTLKFAINLRNENLAYPKISKALKRERTTRPLWIGCPLFDLYHMNVGYHVGGRILAARNKWRGILSHTPTNATQW